MPTKNGLIRRFAELRIGILISAVAVWSIASAANAAVIFSVLTFSTNPLNAMNPGDEFTLDIRISSTGQPGVLAIGAAVTGYDPNVVAFLSGEAVDSFLNTTCGPASTCSGGISNLHAGPLVETNDPTLGPMVRFAEGATIVGTSGTGAIDPGLDGTTSDAQFRVRFRILGGVGTTVLNIGTALPPEVGLDVFYEGTGGVPQQAINAAVQVSVLPEPGTSVLIGLGLAALTRVRRAR